MGQEIPEVVSVTQVYVIDGTTVGLVFSDGYSIAADLKPLMVGPVFDEIFASDIFDTVHLDVEGGTIAWANGADIAPEVLRDL